MYKEHNNKYPSFKPNINNNPEINYPDLGGGKALIEYINMLGIKLSICILYMYLYIMFFIL